MTTKAKEFGSLPVLAPNLSSSKGIAISSSFIAQIPSRAPYILDSQQRSPQYFPWLLDILGELRSDLNIPNGKNLDQGQIPLKKSPSKTRGKGAVPPAPVPKTLAPLGGLTEPGKILVIGQSTAGKLAKYMKDVLNIEGVEHQLSMAPLTDHKVDRLIAYLEASNLKKNDTVIFTGKQKGKKFHLADSKGLKLVVPSTASRYTIFSRGLRMLLAP